MAILAMDEKSKNGFTFDEFNKKELDSALYRALSYWHNNKKNLLPLIENGIKTDHSLDKTAKEYIQLYKQLISS